MDDRRRRKEEWVAETIEGFLLIACLLATLVFWMAFTGLMPGGGL